MEPDRGRYCNTNTTIDEYLGLVRRSRGKTGTYITMTLEIGSGEEVQDLGADTFLEMVPYP